MSNEQTHGIHLKVQWIEKVIYTINYRMGGSNVFEEHLNALSFAVDMRTICSRYHSTFLELHIIEVCEVIVIEQPWDVLPSVVFVFNRFHSRNSIYSMCPETIVVITVIPFEVFVNDYLLCAAIWNQKTINTKYLLWNKFFQMRTTDTSLLCAFRSRKRKRSVIIFLTLYTSTNRGTTS